MPASSFRLRRGTALATLAVAACASTGTSPSQERVLLSRVPSLTPTSRVIDAKRIRRSGAVTAWDAIRLLVPRYRLQPSRSSSLRMYGMPDARHFDSSIHLVVDGHLISDLDALQVIPAREILAIHLLNASEAAIYLGPGTGGGAIVVQTLGARGTP
jgi:hypothetical protein